MTRTANNRTTELCRMLDERGVEWEHEWLDYGEQIRWISENGHFCFYETGSMDSVRLTVNGITPQQAIAATLGSGTLTCGEPSDREGVSIGEALCSPIAAKRKGIF